MERTFVMLKPDGVQRGLAGEVVGRLEKKGLRLAAARLLWIDRDLAERHYAAHVDKPFFEDLVRFITSGPVLAMVWEAEGAIDLVRGLMGPTNAAVAPPGTIRGDLALSIEKNIVHGSDSLEAAAREIALFFEPNELCDYERAIDPWLTGS